MFHFTVTSLWRDCRLRVVFKASREALCAVRNRLPRYVAGAPWGLHFWIADDMGVAWAATGVFPGSGHYRIFTNIFLGGPEVIKFVFSYSKLRKQLFSLTFSKSGGGWWGSLSRIFLMIPSVLNPSSVLDLECDNQCTIVLIIFAHFVVVAVPIKLLNKPVASLHSDVCDTRCTTGRHCCGHIYV